MPKPACRMTPSASGRVLKKPNDFAAWAMGRSGARRPGYSLSQVFCTGSDL